MADVIASCLRMPFALPDEGDGDVRTADLDGLQEVHVRRAAGSILTTHLRDPRPAGQRRGVPADDRTGRSWPSRGPTGYEARPTRKSTASGRSAGPSTVIPAPPSSRSGRMSMS